MTPCLWHVQDTHTHTYVKDGKWSFGRGRNKKKLLKGTGFLFRVMKHLKLDYVNNCVTWQMHWRPLNCQFSMAGFYGVWMGVSYVSIELVNTVCSHAWSTHSFSSWGHPGVNEASLLALMGSWLEGTRLGTEHGTTKLACPIVLGILMVLVRKCPERHRGTRLWLTRILPKQVGDWGSPKGQARAKKSRKETLRDLGCMGETDVLSDTLTSVQRHPKRVCPPQTSSLPLEPQVHGVKPASVIRVPLFLH